MSTQAPLSLRPELEFELFKLVLLRESYIQRLEKKLSESNGYIEIGLVGMFDVLRDTSIEVVETVRLWERAQLEYPNVKPFLWNGKPYLEKIVNDVQFITKYPQISSWLGFSVENNPFLAPPELLYDEVQIPPDSFVIFGRRPDRLLQKKKPTKKEKFTKSPYLTPIINDPEVFTSLNATNQLKKAFKPKEQMTEEDIEIEKSLEKLSDPFESSISPETLKRMRTCWKILCTVNAEYFSSLFDARTDEFHLSDSSILQQTSSYQSTSSNVDQQVSAVVGTESVAFEDSNITGRNEFTRSKDQFKRSMVQFGHVIL